MSEPIRGFQSRFLLYGALWLDAYLQIGRPSFTTAWRPMGQTGRVPYTITASPKNPTTTGGCA